MHVCFFEIEVLNQGLIICTLTREGELGENKTKVGYIFINFLKN